MPGSSPRPAALHELATLAEVLGEAFADYPWTRWTVPGAGSLERLTEIQHLYLAHAHEGGGRVWTSPGLDAVAVLIPSTMADPAPETVERIVNLHGDGWQRVVAHEVVAAPLRPAADWVLATVGVAQGRRGQGIGTAVLRAALADVGEASVLLETSSAQNVRLYERLGFRVVGEVDGDGPDVWLMLR